MMPPGGRLEPGGATGEEPAANASDARDAPGTEGGRTGTPAPEAAACDLPLLLENLAAFGDACETCSGGAHAPIPKPGYALSKSAGTTPDHDRDDIQIAVLHPNHSLNITIA